MSKVTSAKGYCIKDTKDYLNFELIEYPLAKEQDDMITVAVECCGVCGSDHHTISGGWGELVFKPCVTGHEVIGKVVSTGSAVTEFKVGDRVGVGAQKGSCLKCKACINDNEQYCPVHIVHGYNTLWPTGENCQGGYSTHVQGQEKFVFKIPDGLASTDAASMLCAGLTSFSPLFRNNVGPGKKVGIVGIGGLGHYGVLFAAAMGAEVYAFSHGTKKKEDALKMGAKHFVVTHDGFEKDLAGELDFILCTASSGSLPVNQLLSTLGVHGKFCFVGMPEEDDGMPSLSPQVMSANGCYVGSSHIGSKKDCYAMFDLVVKHNIKPWVQTMPMKDAAKAIKAVEDGSVRYRTVLTQDII